MAMPGQAVKAIALTQERRGHGISSTAFFLARALTQLHVPVLLADLTERHAKLRELEQQHPTPRLVLWSPPPVALRNPPAMLASVREQVAGRARCILLDGDLATIEKFALMPARTGLDYLLVATEPTLEGKRAAAHIADRFPTLRDIQRLGVVFARVSNQEIEELPGEIEGGLPVVGYWPADYRLATADDFAASGPLPSEPQQQYLAAITRLATTTIRLLGLNR